MAGQLNGAGTFSNFHMLIYINNYKKVSYRKQIARQHSCHKKFLDRARGMADLVNIFRLDALALSVIATATWLAGWLAGCHTPVLYQNR